MKLAKLLLAGSLLTVMPSMASAQQALTALVDHVLTETDGTDSTDER